MSTSPNGRRTLCVIAYVGIENPATRLRIMQFYPALEAEGYLIRPFYVPYTDSAARTWSMRELVAAVRSSDVIFVQRVLSWWLLPLLRLAGRPIVFDVDDAIHYIRQSQFESSIDPQTIRQRLVVEYRRLLRGGAFFSSRKRLLDRMMHQAAGLVVGNDNLAEYARSAGVHSVVLPTAVPVETFPVHINGDDGPVRIGWIGVPSNLFHLRLLENVFAELTRRYGDRVRLVIVSTRGLDDLPIATEFIPWSLDTESDVTASFDIGIMPLQDDLFSRGKCSFKAIYCMGHGVPVVISPVGMNTQLVEHGVNGFLTSSDEEWVASLTALIDNVEVRDRMGRAARATIESRYAAGAIFQQLRDVLATASALRTDPAPHRERGRP